MKAKTFCYPSLGDPFEKVLNDWLKEEGNIFISATEVISHPAASCLIVFYDERRGATPRTGEGAQPIQSKIPRERFPHCPKCNSIMTIRARKDGNGMFFGCPNFPECNGIVNFGPQDYADCGRTPPESPRVPPSLPVMPSSSSGYYGRGPGFAGEDDDGGDIPF